MPVPLDPSPSPLARELQRPIVRKLYIAFLVEIAVIGGWAAWVGLVTRGWL